MAIVPLLTVAERKILGRFQNRYGPNRVGPFGLLQPLADAVQLISMGLALLGTIMMAGSLSLTQIVEAQHSIWYVVPQFVGFITFVVAGFAEANRAPFDLPEADAELVAGYQTEYGGMRYGSFAMAEYIEMFVISGIGVTFFLGGWHGPGPGFLDPVWVLIKILALVFVYM